jgi:protein-L-isoaspartate(D-aspartate) O-methyltransferase
MAKMRHDRPAETATTSGRSGHDRPTTTVTSNGRSGPDAFTPDRPADAIFVNAGVSHLSPVWLDALAENGRLLVALTNDNQRGGFLLIERSAGKALRYPVRYISDTGIFPCVGGRDPAAEERLKAAMARSRLTAVRSLRRTPEKPDETCWLAGEGWWLSTAEADGSRLS